MAISKTQSVLSMKVFFQDTIDDNPAAQLQIQTVIDDPDDDDLPLVTVRDAYLPYSYTDYETQETVLTDVSGYDQAVQDIFAVIWTTDD